MNPLRRPHINLPNLPIFFKTPCLLIVVVLVLQISLMTKWYVFSFWKMKGMNIRRRSQIQKLEIVIEYISWNIGDIPPFFTSPLSAYNIKIELKSN